MPRRRRPGSTPPTGCRSAPSRRRCRAPPTSTRRSSIASATGSGGPSGSSSGASSSSPSRATSWRSTSPASRSSSSATGAGDISAHYDVCRHRGSRLTTPDQRADPATVDPASRRRRRSRGQPRPPARRPGPSGRFKGVIRCPYHSWCYELDGRVRNAPFLGESDALRARRRSACTPWRSTPGPAGCSSTCRRSGSRRATRWRRSWARSRRASRATRWPTCGPRAGSSTTSAANWKVIVENYNECYHCSGVHPELCRIVPAFREKGGGNLDWDAGVPQAEGTFTFTLTGRSDRAPFPGLDADEQVRHKGELVVPEPDDQPVRRPRGLVHARAQGARPDARRRRLAVPPRRDREARRSTPRTPSSSGTSSTARTGRCARASSPG